MTDFRALIERLSQARVDFIIVGGVAAAAHGAVRTTLDLDLVYRRTPENLQLGDVDLLGEITAGGGYDALLPHTVEKLLELRRG